MKKLFGFVVLSFSIITVSTAFAYSLPKDNSGAEYFYIFGPGAPATYGANKDIPDFALYIDVPQDENRDVLISVYDPSTSGRIDEIVDRDSYRSTVTEFSIYGSRLLDNKQFGAERKYARTYYNFGPYSKIQGAKVGDAYRFKLEVKTLQGNDNNLFKVKILPDTARAFSMYIPLRLLAKEGEKMYLYPEIPAGVREIDVENYDLDPDGGTSALYDPQTSKYYLIKVSNTAEWSHTIIPINSDSPRRVEYIITKGTQRNANAGFAVKDDRGNLLPIYFDVGKPQMSVIKTEPPKEVPVCNVFTFDATGSYDPADQKLSFLWDFGDGATSDKPIVTHAYEKAGNYKVTLKVTNNSGLECNSATVTQVVRANMAPNVVFSAPDIVCRGENVTFDAGATTSNAYRLSYTWDLGDGTRAEGQRITKVYDRGGRYNVVLTVDDNEGTPCSKGIFSKVIRVNSLPTANAGGDVKICLNAEQEYKVNFDGTRSSDPDGDSLTYKWDFGDGSTGVGSKVSHVYPKGGNYTARLIVDDGSGAACSSSEDTVDIRLNKAPVADAGPNLVCCVDTENIFDGSKSSDPDGDPLSYYWDFGDGAKAEGVRVKHVYTKPGTYNVTLMAKDSSGAECGSSVDSFVATVHAKPVPVIKTR